MSLRNALLRVAFRAYPLSKGRYRLMSALERRLSSGPACIEGLWGDTRLGLDLARPGLQRSFYYFMPEGYEASTQRYLRSALKPGMTAVDVGCHIGLLTLLMARQVGPSGRVYGYEPDPDNYRQLCHNMTLNRFDHVRALNLAASDRRAQLVLGTGRTGSDHAVRREGGEGITVGAEPLADLWRREKLSRLDLLKIDAEGVEDLVLGGLGDHLNTASIPRIVCEVHSSHKQGPVGGDRVRRKLYEAGYHSYVLDPVLAKGDFLSEIAPDRTIRGLQNLLFCTPEIVAADAQR